MASYVYYNNIMLLVDELITFTRIPVYDGPTKLYDRVTLHVRATYNPNVNSYVPNPVVMGLFIQPVAQDNAAAPVTDAVLRFNLTQPRALLLFVVGEQIVLQSPGFQPNEDPPIIGNFNPANQNLTLYYSDAHGGPYPTLNSIVAMVGYKTFVVDFAVETFISESWNVAIAGVAPVCLSHRWMRREDIDIDFYKTIHTIGHAHFRADILSVFQQADNTGPTDQSNFSDRNPNTAVVPDDFRNYLFHAVQPGFQRVAASISPSEDGMSIEYYLVDRQQNVIFPNGITRVEAIQSISSKTGAGAEFLKSIWKRANENDEVGRWAPNAGVMAAAAAASPAGAMAIGGAKVWNWMFGKKGVFNGLGILDVAAQGAMAFEDLLHGDLIPKMTVNITASVWGDPGVLPATLASTVYNVVFNRFKILVNNGIFVNCARTECQWHWDMVNKNCSLTVSKTMAMPLQIAQPDGLGPIGAIPNFQAFTPGFMYTETPQFGNPASGSKPIPNSNRAYDPSTLYNSLAAQIFLVNFTGTPTPGFPPAAQQVP